MFSPVHTNKAERMIHPLLWKLHHWRQFTYFVIKLVMLSDDLNTHVCFVFSISMFALIWTSSVSCQPKPISLHSTSSGHVPPEPSAGVYRCLIMQRLALVEIIFTLCCRKHLSWQIIWIKALLWALARSCMYRWFVIRAVLRWVSSDWPDYSSWTPGGKPLAHPR